MTEQTLLQQAIEQHQAGRLAEAEQLYLSILHSDPKHPEVNHNLGVLAIQNRQPDASLSYFMTALEADSSCAQYWLSAIDALLQAGQLETAREILTIGRQRGLQGVALDALVARMEANTQTTAQRYSEDRLNEPSPQEINALLALFNQGRYSDAANLAQSMTGRFPQHGFGWKVLGTAFKLMGRDQDALAAMYKAASLSPDDAEAHNNLGVTLKGLGRLDEAEISYNRALAIEPNDAEAHYNLGAVLQGLDRPTEAEISYRRALDIKPDFAEAYNNLGIMLHDLGRPNEAEACYRRALEVKPNYTEAYTNLGKTLKFCRNVPSSSAPGLADYLPV